MKFEELQPYESYLESDVPWIECVPDHWKVLPLGGQLVERKEKNKPIKTREILSLGLRTGVIPYSEKKTGGNKAKDDLTAYVLAYPGDLVVNSMNVVVGSVGLSKYFGAVSPVYFVLRPRFPTDHIKYFDAVFHVATFQRSLFGLGNGIMFIESRSTGKLNTIRLRIPFSKLKRVFIPVPPPDEQELIVRFLDWANLRLGKAIAAKRKVIALLEEQKQAIIHRAVTRGLDDSVPLKHSGIAWLGDVPNHWQVKRIKYLMKVVDNRSENGDEVLLSMRKYHGLVPYHEHFSKPPQAATLKGFKIIEKGQIATNRMQAGFGLIFESTMKGIVSPDFGVFQPTGEVVPEFLGLVFRSRLVRAKFHRESKGLGTGKSGFMRLYDDRIGWIHIAYPPTVEEQTNILQKLAVELEEIAKPREIVEREIGLLQEYKARLIADVVTGKLDVREFARTLPSDIAEQAAELADSELGGEDLSEADEELVEEPA
ncbi:MAG: restriction endonuclease subunit S [Pirellula sp.]